MSVLQKIAYLQNRRDEAPNIELAQQLAASENKAGINEIAENLRNKDKQIQSDCIKVLYEIGSIKPELIAEYAEPLIKLLHHKNNRLVWGAMTALASVARLQAGVIHDNLETIYAVMEQGSVITVDNGIKVLAAAASANEKYNAAIFPYLIQHLKTCRSKEVGQHAESTFIAVNGSNKAEFADVLKEREPSLTSSQLARVKKLYKALEARV